MEHPTRAYGVDEGRRCKICGEWEAYHGGVEGIYSRLSLDYLSFYLWRVWSWVRYPREWRLEIMMLLIRLDVRYENRLTGWMREIAYRKGWSE